MQLRTGVDPDLEEQATEMIRAWVGTYHYRGKFFLNPERERLWRRHTAYFRDGPRPDGDYWKVANTAQTYLNNHAPGTANRFSQVHMADDWPVFLHGGWSGPEGQGPGRTQQAQVAWVKAGGRRKSSRRPDNLSGKRFGHLWVLGPAPDHGDGDRCWRVLCNCGARTVVTGDDLHGGSARSCGCCPDTLSR